MGKSNLSFRGSNHFYLTEFLIFIMGLFLVISFSCGKKQSGFVPLTSVFDKTDSLLISDKLGISQLLDVDKLNDSVFVVIDFPSRSIYSLNVKTRKINQIGRTGRGPGEYIWPDRLEIGNNEHIYFSDFQARYIEEIDNSGNYYRKISSLVPIRRFCIDHSLNLYVLSSINYQIWAYDKRGNLKKKLFPIPKEYKYPLLKSHGGGICCDDSSNVYFVNAVEYKIYKLGPGFNIVNRFGREDAPFYKKVPKEIRGNSYLNINRAERYKLLTNFTVILDLYFLRSGSGYILVCLKNPSDDLFMDIWNTKGNFIKSIHFSKKEYPIGVTNDELYTIKEVKETEEEIVFWLNTYCMKDIGGN